MRFWSLPAAGMLLGGAFPSAPGAEATAPPLDGGWGVDACLSAHVPAAAVPDYLSLLEKTRLRWLRERDLGMPGEGRLAVWQRLKAAGFRVLASASLPGGDSPEQSGNQLTEDLRLVFRQSRHLAERAGGAVDVWEMNNEADIGFGRDLPDRTAAYEKAVYLGLKTGSRKSGRETGVLIGALALPPGPWLERAARNGLCDYTDGWNFHFYGHARDLEGTIHAQRAAARSYAPDRRLPVWITECGMNAAAEGHLDDPHAQKLQQIFTVATARTAGREAIDVFMPFILVHAGDGYALASSPEHPSPAWTDYAAFTRSHPLGSGPALLPPRTPPSPVVVQWMPDNITCTPHKVGGIYWFDREGGRFLPIEGEIAIYNFSDAPVKGTLELKVAPGIRMKIENAQVGIPSPVDLPALGCVRLPVKLELRGARYFFGEIEGEFKTQGSPARSALMFAVGTRPEDSLLSREIPIRGRAPEEDFQWIWSPEPYRAEGRAGPWLGVNGVRVEAPRGTDSLDDGCSMELTTRSADPRLPPMAMTKVEGLPEVADAFVRLRVKQDGPARTSFRVDLVDQRGQRFTVAEDFGRNGVDLEGNEVFLSYRDFHIYAWGRCTERPVFRPGDIREIQLRLFSEWPAGPASVRLDVVAPLEGDH